MKGRNPPIGSVQFGISFSIQFGLRPWNQIWIKGCGKYSDWFRQMQLSHWWRWISSKNTLINIRKMLLKFTPESNTVSGQLPCAFCPFLLSTHKESQGKGEWAFSIRFGTHKPKHLVHFPLILALHPLRVLTDSGALLNAQRCRLE